MDTAELQTELHERLEKLPIQPNPALAKAARTGRQRPESHRRPDHGLRRLDAVRFLSTFVLISENRTDAKRQVVANLEWKTAREEDRQNRELIDLSNEILELTKAIHDRENSR